MKALLDIKRFKFYAWVGLAFIVLGLFADMHARLPNLPLRLLNNIWMCLYLTILIYILFEYSYKKIRWKKFFSSILIIALFIFLCSEGSYLWRLLGITIGVYKDFSLPSQDKHIVAGQMEYSVSAIFFFGVIRFIYNHIKLRQTAQTLRIEKQQAELNYLKSQTNPHFLFNTLNNIYSLARDKSDLAPETILRLSKILRYMLYETGGEYIPVEQELKIISDYIALEKLRYDDSLKVSFNHNIENMKQAFPPLLLIPLVENAFKHGASETRHEPYIDIHLSIIKLQLSFLVKNSVEGNNGSGQVK